MKKVILILFFCIHLIPSSFAQRNYAQELVHLLLQGECFKAKEFRMQYADKLPEHDKALDLVYKSHMALFFNKPDSATIYLKDLLICYEDFLGPLASFYYGKLLRIYADSQQFEKGLNVCDQMITLYNKYAYRINKDVLERELDFVENVKTSLRSRLNNDEPIIKIKRVDSVKPVELIKNEYIRFYGNYNGNSTETLFDTGVSDYFHISKKIADKIGVRTVHINQDSIQIVNGIPQKGYEGIIDSITIGNINLYNIPVLVFHKGFMPYFTESIDNDIKKIIQEAFKDEQVIMGLPTMKLIGKFEFDWKNGSLTFPENAKFAETNTISNIYFHDQRAYLGLTINDLNYTGFFDAGSNNFIDLSYPFYEKYKNSISIDTTIQKPPLNNYSLTNALVGAPYEIVKDPIVLLKNKKINCEQAQIRVFDAILPGTIFDGIVGVNFLKELGSKVIIDFDNMNIEGGRSYNKKGGNKK
ncbi:MAG: hypothetical protein PARBA_01203 [Parabacteroides sp.]